jgi:hypothetical protein
MSAALARPFRNPLREFDPTEYDCLLRKLREGEYVSRADLARVRKARPEEPEPAQILAYERDLAAGKIKRPGRRKHDTIEDVFYETMALILYDWLLERIRIRQETVGLNGWSAMKGKSWWEGSPAQRALRMLRERKRFRHLSEGRLRNIISERRKRYGWSKRDSTYRE